MLLPKKDFLRSYWKQLRKSGNFYFHVKSDSQGIESNNFFCGTTEIRYI